MLTALSAFFYVFRLFLSFFAFVQQLGLHYIHYDRGQCQEQQALRKVQRSMQERAVSLTRMRSRCTHSILKDDLWKIQPSPNFNKLLRPAASLRSFNHFSVFCFRLFVFRNKSQSYINSPAPKDCGGKHVSSTRTERKDRQASLKL